MPDNLFEDMVSAAAAGNLAGRTNAVREAIQLVALAGLNRGGFFECAAFYGGTCQRVFYGLDRFSEDLDFSLLAPSNDFALEKFFTVLLDEFALVGIDAVIDKKMKTTETAIVSAFLKAGGPSPTYPDLKIKIEVDTNPPPLFETEYKLSMLPYSFMARCYTPPSSFAGKMSALLYRNWPNRVKGRDWYDFEWYVRKGVTLDLTHLNAHARQFAKIKEDFTEESFRIFLKEKIQTADIDKIKEDVIPFIYDTGRLDIWNREYFAAVADLMKITVR